ncbi:MULTISPECIES: sulfite exporter TauE/SafE family protein [unclassified Microbacterium]|uniref:sulfite exporter TauE/SafE family protein n=1 Tax=unclassified Microbacterium TaxID=2609290 RepID=UPI003863526D
MSEAAAPTRTPRFFVLAVVIGLIAGLMSGMFGVGGGTVIVPMLVTLLGFDQRRAAGTSLAAIVPTAAVGVISYATVGSVAWVPAVILAAAAVIGAQIGTWLLARLPQNAIRWGFIGFLLVVIVMLFIVVPSRDADVPLTWFTGTGFVVLGLITGVMAGLLGVGGGVIVVPALMILFGMSDLEAKGTSLLMMIPTAISGTIGNLRRRNVDLLAGVLIGAAACTTTALGAWFATLVDPMTANILFAAYLAFIAIQLSIKAWRARRTR